MSEQITSQTEGIIDSVTAAEMLGITQNNLRQLVFRKLLSPVGKERRRSLFTLANVEQVKAARNNANPSA